MKFFIGLKMITKFFIEAKMYSFFTWTANKIMNICKNYLRN